ncbi:ferrous iron transport protein A [Lachnospiraceae bacterium PF1-21]|uniref:Ferrous iron transport protein A n=1 Tax=Ohessyouella blattaphilus TaxID=2949333 RepID=A0ABT1EIA9_9FIRM|nr:FeoA family protein [Ohessyouella blattaphilus]MCP1110438.1 ferrous iron transport protein A [Ohessyouella blattaphilus]MCR8563832.1 ferrous iron transport protein A [Ohessyouella blattaphilus]
MQKLNELQPGQQGTIAGVQGDTRFLTRVISIGLTVGSRVEVLRNEKKMPLLLYGRDSVVALNREESDNILVEVRA